jgi:hypothetical protein
MLVLVWILNLLISWWNARAVGLSWVEARHYGGWPRLMCWAGAVQSAAGFTWCYLLALAFGGWYFDFLPDRALTIMLGIGYLIIVPAMLLSGLAIMLDSWAQAYRSGSLLDIGIASYNTYAQIHNTYAAAESFSAVIQGLGEALTPSSDSDDDSSGLVIVLGIVAAVVSVGLGVLTTYTIINRYAGSVPLPAKKEAAEQ